MGARSDAFRRRKARGVADTFLVIDDHLRESIGLSQREGWAVLAYLLGMAREQLHDDMKREGGLVTARVDDTTAADLPAPARGLMAQAR